MSEEKPLILLTNDDGIRSPGLWAAAEALSELGWVLVVAPRTQQTGAGRSLPVSSGGGIHEEKLTIKGKEWTVFAIEGSPAQAVQHGFLELAHRKPDLVVSGINYGENLGTGVTVSGTVGAALEAAALGVPALAVSRQVDISLHLSYDRIDFSAAAYFTRLFGAWMLSHVPPHDVDVLKVDVPENATPDTPWRVTRLSRRRVHWPTPPERTSDGSGRLGYKRSVRPEEAEPDSDVYAVLHEGIVSVTPLSLDLTSRIDLQAFERELANQEG